MKKFLLFAMLACLLLVFGAERLWDFSGKKTRAEVDDGAAAARLQSEAHSETRRFSAYIPSVRIDNRVQIETGGGFGLVNPYLAPALFELDEFFTPLGGNISVFYKNIESGFTYVHNPSRVFFAASLSKSNHALYTFLLAEHGMADLDALHTFTAADRWGGTGVLRFEPPGTHLTTRELLGLSIRESDNAAFRMLVSEFADVRVSYADFVAEIGADTNMIGDVFSQNTHIEDAGMWMYNIFRYIEGPGQFAHYFKYDLLNTAATSHADFARGAGSRAVGGRVNVAMLTADYPLARKYGWAHGAFHDAGIIYAPSPYILVVLSNMDNGAHALFEEISWFVQDFNDQMFLPADFDFEFPEPYAPLQGPMNYNGHLQNFSEGNGFRLGIPAFADSAYNGFLVQHTFSPMAHFIEQDFSKKTDKFEGVRSRFFGGD